jgi:hypothetical protein
MSSIRFEIEEAMYSKKAIHESRYLRQARPNIGQYVDLPHGKPC